MKMMMYWFEFVLFSGGSRYILSAGDTMQYQSIISYVKPFQLYMQ